MGKFILFTLILGLTTTGLLAGGGLSEEDISEAETLAKSSIKFEDYIQDLTKQNQSTQSDSKGLEKSNKECVEDSTPEKKPIKPTWLTLEPFEFEYKGVAYTFYMANCFLSSSSWGEIAAYPGKVDKSKIDYGSGGFWDLGEVEPFLSTLKYEYIPANDSQPSSIIIEHVDAGYKAGGKGYAQATLKYFIGEFVKKRTNVTRVFADLRAPKSRHYFPKYGFKTGSLGIKFERGMAYPYNWIKETE